jgi:hypothetical protein
MGKTGAIKGEVELWITLYFGTKRKCDLYNFISYRWMPSPAWSTRTTARYMRCMLSERTISKIHGSKLRLCS